jgi:hypothetical protein
MDFWIKLIIGGIVVAAWIAGNIRERQKAAEKAAPPPLPDDRDAPAPAGKVDDLRDFLKQIRTRKDELEPRRIDEPMPAVLVEEPPRREPPKWAPPPVPVVKQKRPQLDIAATLARRAAEVVSLVPEPIKLTPASASDPVPSVSRSKASTPAAREVLRLLKSPTSVATGFLLQEILGKPLAKRRRKSN